MQSIEERRQHPRYPAPAMELMARPLEEASNEWLTGKLRAVDFNRFGMSLETDFPLLAGDQINLVLSGEDERRAEIRAEVRNRQRLLNGYRYGVSFLLDQSRGSKKDAHDILMFELKAVTR